MLGLHLNIVNTEKMLQFGTKSSRRAWHVVPTREIKIKHQARIFHFPLYFVGDKEQSNDYENDQIRNA